MKKIVLSVIIILTLSIHADQVDSTQISFQPLSPEPQHRQAAKIIVHLLTNSHYKKIALNDSLSSQAFDRYIERLDYNRLYFLQSDIDELEQYRYRFDNYYGSGQLEVAYDIFDLYAERASERLKYIFKRLDEGFDFTIDESVMLDRSEAPWAKTREELDELWRKRLKYEALNLKLAGKDSEGIAKTLRKRYMRVKRNIEQYQSEDVFQLLMNALAESFDPHTDYLSPKNFDNFRIHMSQSLEGIGARLSTENEYTKVVEIVPGGPAARGNELYPNDRILGVGQGEEGEIVDVVGWRIDDVVQLIRGAKGTLVRLQLLRAGESIGAQTDTIALVRDKIKLEDQSAQSDTVQIIHQGRKMTFGVIDIPAFYSDYEAKRAGDKDYKSTTHDVEKLVKELEALNVDGIIIDLRHNGGGYLDEAVNLTGLFIDTGPVVQVRDSRGRLNVERDYDAGMIYDGPLAVIIDRLSASASEIFAAAIQDYNRGVIVGGQSFGKGTVQNAIDLNRFIRNSDAELGQLKITVAKFYRINGGSTQHAGVSPDISFPSRYGLMDIGESSSKNALLWDKISPVPYDIYRPTSDIIPQLEVQHNMRMENNTDYAALLDKISKYEESKNHKEISLMESKRREERKKEGKSEKKPEADEEEADADAENDSTNHVQKDLEMRESAHVLGDYLMLSETQSSMR